MSPRLMTGATREAQQVLRQRVRANLLRKSWRAHATVRPARILVAACSDITAHTHQPSPTRWRDRTSSLQPRSALFTGRHYGWRMAEETLIQKIRRLPPERVAEVEDFVDFLMARDQDRDFTQASARLSEEAFRAVWDNSDDAEYDRL
jgi:hypothetical protein